MDEISKRRKWRRWLGVIEAEVSRLLNERRVYRDVRDRLVDNPEWVAWLDHLYLVGVSLAIRRLADANPRHRTISLVKLLQDMEIHAECLSRRSALRSADMAQREEVNRLFARLAGEGALHIPKTVIRQWLEDFDNLATPFRRWVDHRIAHHDLSVDCPPPEHHQAEQILDALNDMVKMLKLLLGA
ncbi:MAG: hypothetical protein HPY54_02070 [Chthonomonadetes bacterium]|nr:hypothetical protein [Chthonomonadetes bacterium]